MTYLMFLKSIDRGLGWFLLPVTRNYTRYQVELEPEHWEKVEAAINCLEDFRQEVKELIRRVK
jgi:hypothetical protein